MRLSEAWRISRVPYRELAYRPLVRAGYSLKGKNAKDDARIVRTILFSASVNKAFFALFTMAGSVFPFILYRLRFQSVSLASAVSLSLVLFLGYLVLYLIQVLPSFVSAESFTPLTTLPMSTREVSLVTFLSYLRTVDFVLILGISAQILVVAYITASALGVLLMLAAALANSVFGTAVSLLLTGLFRGTVSIGGRSRTAGILRMLLVVMWGLGVLSVVFLFNLASVLTPYLDAVLTIANRPELLIIAMIYPFPFSMLVADTAGATLSRSAILLSAASAAAYCVFVPIAARWSLRRIDSVGRGAALALGERSDGDFRVTTRAPLAAYIIKDLRVASRNPASGFLFALPIFETLAVILPLTSSHIVKISIVLVASAVGGGFALFVAFLLTAVENVRMEYSDVLPMGPATPTLAKAAVAMMSYLPAPFSLVLVSSGKITDSTGLLIPFVMILSVSAAALGEVAVLRRLARRGRTTIFNFGGGIGLGMGVMLVPIIAYAWTFFSTHDHVGSVLVALAFAVAELAIALLLVRRGR